MSGSIDYEYLERRYRESLESAEKATDPGIAKVHRGFAEAYARAMKAESAQPSVSPATGRANA